MWSLLQKVYSQGPFSRATSSYRGEGTSVNLGFVLTILKEWFTAEGENYGFFRSVSLKALGLRIQLGHAPNQTCQFPRGCRKDKFVVICETGIHDIFVYFCGCRSEQEFPQWKQLIQFGLWPATTKQPNTAATMSLLRLFHTVNLEARVPASEFYSALEKLTDGEGLVKVHVGDLCPFLLQTLIK
jgi:hypothetical protein